MKKWPVRMNAGFPACILPQSVEALPRAIVEDPHAAANPPDFPHADEPGFASATRLEIGKGRGRNHVKKKWSRVISN